MPNTPCSLSLPTGDTLGRTPLGECELALSALGALTWYLMDCRLEEQLLTRRMFERYAPPDEWMGGDAVGTVSSAPPAFITNRHHMVRMSEEGRLMPQ